MLWMRPSSPSAMWAYTATCTGSTTPPPTCALRGLDEADIVKTDGRAVYALRSDGRSIAVVAPDGAQLDEVAAVDAPDGREICEFYVAEGRLYAILTTSYPIDDCLVGDVASVPDTSPEDVQVATYDLSDPSSPRLLGTVTQSGWYDTSRMADGYLYLFTHFSAGPRPEGVVTDLKRDVPSVDGETVSCEDIYLPASGKARDYLVVGSLKLSGPAQMVESKAIMSCGGSLYMGSDNLYLTESVYENDAEATAICRLFLLRRHGDAGGRGQRARHRERQLQHRRVRGHPPRRDDVVRERGRRVGERRLRA